MKTKSLIYLVGAFLLLFILAACGGEDPTPTPAPTVAPPPAVSTIVLPPAQPAASFCDTINPTWFSVNTAGLNYSWQANCVPATPYDQSQPPGPKGLPEHIEINFGVTNPADKQPNDPVIYIIPVAEYKAMWDAAGTPPSARPWMPNKPCSPANQCPFPALAFCPSKKLSVYWM